MKSSLVEYLSSAAGMVNSSLIASLIDERNGGQNRPHRVKTITDDVCIKRTEIEGLIRTQLNEFCSKVAGATLESDVI